MKLRYYMRGLGIGIVVTAILMGVTLNGKTEKLTDAEIIERAEALGMEQKYESTVLADTVENKETEDNAAKPEEEKQPQEIETDVSGNSAEDETEEEVSEEISEEETEEMPDSEVKETVQITVVGGDGSGTVARKLAEAGLVEDAKAYDEYLCSNGYDKRICTGTHSIPVGASAEDIAEIITSRP
jgi:hypothetical protein